MGSVQTNIFNNSVPGVTYTIADVSVGGTIDNTKWINIRDTINTERARRGDSSMPDPGFDEGTLIQNTDIDALYAAINYNSWAAVDYTTANTIGASDINTLIDRIIFSGAQCICNANYCTCNCNYCTCNCDYACTCNCNYSSDKRLKKDITFVRKQGGLNVYSWKYIWNNSKTFEGVIAQELIGTKYSNALIIDSNGYYAVNYSMIPVEFKEI